MKTRQIQIQFHTPAFLGDATQSGRWRTPPFKAQLRQWWRMAYSAQQNFRVNVSEMREMEGRLFGHAWLDSDRNDRGEEVKARRSEVRIRLSHWSVGKENQWSAKDSQVVHPNVPQPIGAQLYMGFGPLIQGTALKANAAIQAKEEAQLKIAFPDESAALINAALHLMTLYGTVGGRSRNGWGSYSLTNITGTDKPIDTVFTQTLANCLRSDWPHALGSDNKGPLIWQTEPQKDWVTLMRTLAQVKIGVRTKFKFNSGKNASAPEDRHWLSYPVTNHSVATWGKNARLPNQLRFKVRPTAADQIVGVIFHVPHLPPVEFSPQVQTLERVWSEVHAHLDQINFIKRISA